MKRDSILIWGNTGEGVVSGQKLKIKSKRTMGTKRTFEEMSQHDLISKMPSIGDEYAQRLTELGLVSVQHLAQVGTFGFPSVDTVLCKLYKSKGQMNRAKLMDLIELSQSIVNK